MPGVIDPSLFFDEDGTCIISGREKIPGGGRYNGDCEIWIQKLDLQTFRLEGRRILFIWIPEKCNLAGGSSSLLKEMVITIVFHAEGGTEEHHSEMVARSKNIFRPL